MTDYDLTIGNFSDLFFVAIIGILMFICSKIRKDKNELEFEVSRLMRLSQTDDTLAHFLEKEKPIKITTLKCEVTYHRRELEGVTEDQLTERLKQEFAFEIGKEIATKHKLDMYYVKESNQQPDTFKYIAEAYLILKD